MAEAGGALLVMVTAVLDGHLAELSGEVGRALTLVPGTALSSIDARKMADHWQNTMRVFVHNGHIAVSAIYMGNTHKHTHTHT